MVKERVRSGVALGFAVIALVGLVALLLDSRPSESDARATAPVVQGQANLYVAAGGDDASDGGAQTPFATIDHALSVARAGEVIEVGAGSYPRVRTSAQPGSEVIVRPAPDADVTIGGFDLLGARHITLDGLTIAGSVNIRAGSGRVAPTDITLHRDSISGPDSSCVSIRDGAERISLFGNRITDCRIGIAGAAGGSIAQSSDIRIAGNFLQKFSVDGIQFGQWSKVLIAQNVIEDATSADQSIHNDGLQVTGNAHDITIARNRILHSGRQLLFIKDDLGPISDVTVVNNLINDAEAVAVQTFGVTGLVFDHNTVWGGSLGGVWIRPPAAGPSGSTLTVAELQNNLIDSLRVWPGARAKPSRGNVVACPNRAPIAGVRCVTDMGFVDAGGSNFRLRANSRARGMGTGPRSATTKDLFGRPRSQRTPGAIA